jgi:hypothetical protein
MLTVVSEVWWIFRHQFSKIFLQKRGRRGGWWGSFKLDSFTRFNLTGGFFGFKMYFVQHCFICRPSDFTVSEDAGIEPRLLRLRSINATFDINSVAKSLTKFYWAIYKLPSTLVDSDTIQPLCDISIPDAVANPYAGVAEHSAAHLRTQRPRTVK